MDEERWYHGPGLVLHDAPAGLASVPLEVEDQLFGTRATRSIEGGVLAVEVDGDGALLPRAGVVVRSGGASSAQVIERILADSTIISAGPPCFLGRPKRRK